MLLLLLSRTSAVRYLITDIYNLIFIYVSKQTLFPAETSWLVIGLADLSAHVQFFLKTPPWKRNFGNFWYQISFSFSSILGKKKSNVLLSLRSLGGVLLAKLACDSFALTIQSEDRKTSLWGEFKIWLVKKTVSMLYSSERQMYTSLLQRCHSLSEQVELEENQRETENWRFFKHARNMLCCWLW